MMNYICHNHYHHRHRSIFSAVAILVILSHVTSTNTILTMVSSAPISSPFSSSSTQRIPQEPPLYGPARVRLSVQDKYVVLDNGIVQVTISNPSGSITGITTYNNNRTQNLLADQNPEFDRGYWDLVWQGPGITRKKGLLDRLKCTDFHVISQTQDQVEISFTRTWTNNSTSSSSSKPKSKSNPPLNIDKRYILLRGTSGLYTYIIYNRPKGWPHFILANTRLALKLNKTKFHYMAISNTRQREMPLPDDRYPNRSQPLAYPEAVILTNPIESQFKGEVDDKYQYAGDTKDIQLHGWISNPDPESRLTTGLWSIVANNEFRSGGPTKQFITSHVGPTMLTVMLSTHYGGKELMANFSDGEEWRKVLGPVFVYVNEVEGVSSSTGGENDDERRVLWEDAKRQLMYEEKIWPYEFVGSTDYLKSDERGSVTGILSVRDSIENEVVAASGGYVGLAKPGEPGSWQRESKGYQFWTKTDRDGWFKIKNVRPGTYSLYGFVNGVIGDYKYNQTINITPEHDVDLGNIVYEPPREGPTVWEIGVPDRSANEFYIPDPDPTYINKLYLKRSSDRYRQYGLWDRYTELYPQKDLIYTVNVSDYTNDWFFAQVNRKTTNGTYIGTTWQIKFQLNQVAMKGIYILRIALASTSHIDLQVRVNDPQNPPLFRSLEIGQDNSIARHGIHGIYLLFSVRIPSTILVKGMNTIYLTQSLGGDTSPWRGILYDYIRLETPPFFIQI